MQIFKETGAELNSRKAAYQSLLPTINNLHGENAVAEGIPLAPQCSPEFIAMVNKQNLQQCQAYTHYKTGFDIDETAECFAAIVTLPVLLIMGALFSVVSGVEKITSEVSGQNYQTDLLAPIIALLPWTLWNKPRKALEASIIQHQKQQTRFFDAAP